MTSDLRTNESGWLPAEQLVIVWGDAQRAIIPNHLDGIMSKFDPDLLEPVHVSAVVRAPNFRHIIDGNHRVEAVKRLADYGPKQRVPCIIHETCKTPADAAHIFRQLTKNRRNQVGVTDFIVAVTANDEPEMSIARVLRRHGLHVSTGNSPNIVKAVAALRFLHQRCGLAIIGESLGVLKATWPDDPGAFQAPILSGCGLLLFDHPELDSDRLVKVIAKKFTPTTLLAAARAMRNATAQPIHTEVRQVMMNYYNNKLPDKSRLVDEDRRVPAKKKAATAAAAPKTNGQSHLGI